MLTSPAKFELINDLSPKKGSDEKDEGLLVNDHSNHAFVSASKSSKEISKKVLTMKNEFVLFELFPLKRKRSLKNILCD